MTVYVHTYEVQYKGERDYIQYLEKAHGHMVLAYSDDLTIAFLIRGRNTINGMMHAAIHNHFNEQGITVHVRHNSTVAFDSLDFG